MELANLYLKEAAQTLTDKSKWYQKEVTVSTGESEISMKNQPDKIIYDPSKTQDVSFLFDYTNCASSTTTSPTSTITLQK